MEPTWPARGSHARRARLAAIAALGRLVLAAISFLLVAINVLDALIVLGCLFLGTYCAWLSLTRGGALLFVTIPGVLVALTVLVLTAYEHRVGLAVWIGCVLLFGLAARAAVRADRAGRSAAGPPTVPPARRGVLVINPRSGNGKAARVGLAAEAAGRGIHTVELGPGGNLREPVDMAIADLRRPRVAGSRPRLDGGTLGILSARLQEADEVARFVTLMTIGQEWRTDQVRQWSAGTFEVDSTGPVALGIDGEAVRMAPTLRFESRPGALRVRLPATASGLSPSAAAVGMSGRDLRRLVVIAAGR